MKLNASIKWQFGKLIALESHLHGLSSLQRFIVKQICVVTSRSFTQYIPKHLYKRLITVISAQSCPELVLKRVAHVIFEVMGNTCIQLQKLSQYVCWGV